MMYLSTYYKEWVQCNKKDVVRDVTLAKYRMTGRWLESLEPKKDLSELSRQDYQTIIRAYAAKHAHQTVVDFHRQIRSCLLDALDDEIITKDITRRVQLGGLKVNASVKHLEEDEAKLLMKCLEIKYQSALNWDHFILLLITTGIRFSEALALTKEDFDFEKLAINITKSYDYKKKTQKIRFQPTKNTSSIRCVSLDLKTAWILRPLIEKQKDKMPIWPQLCGVGHPPVFNSTINNRLKKRCLSANIPVITLHGLRHTHASVLIAKGVSIQAVAKRLGHANTITTQSTYIHLLKTAEKKANEQIASILINW